MVAVLARTVRGVEWVAADEVAHVLRQAGPLTLAPRQVGFELPGIDERLTRLSTVDDVFVLVGELGEVGTTKDEPQRLASRLDALDWETALTQVSTLRRELASSPLRFDVVASLDGRRRFTRYVVEQAVGAVLARRLDGEFAERDPEAGLEGEVNLTVRVLITGPVAVAGLRLTARPLHRRSYKGDAGPGTLHPPLAAAMLRLARAAEATVVVDPFCGDGTIPIELARSAPGVRVVGADLDPQRLAHARANARRCGADVTLLHADAGRLPLRAGAVDVVVTNPPWQRTVHRAGALARTPHRFPRGLSDVLGKDGTLCLIVDAASDLPSRLDRLGYAIALDQRIRVAGRVSRILVCGPRSTPTLSRSLRSWHRRALAAGLVTADGF